MINIDNTSNNNLMILLSNYYYYRNLWNNLLSVDKSSYLWKKIVDDLFELYKHDFLENEQLFIEKNEELLNQFLLTMHTNM